MSDCHGDLCCTSVCAARPPTMIGLTPWVTYCVRPRGHDEPDHQDQTGQRWQPTQPDHHDE